MLSPRGSLALPLPKGKICGQSPSCLPRVFRSFPSASLIGLCCDLPCVGLEQLGVLWEWYCSHFKCFQNNQPLMDSQAQCFGDWHIQIAKGFEDGRSLSNGAKRGHPSLHWVCRAAKGSTITDLGETISM